eukprot:scaffold5332_cov403-Prasinococcus_capsulatus_cf.AAC.1
MTAESTCCDFTVAMSTQTSMCRTAVGRTRNSRICALALPQVACARLTCAESWLAFRPPTVSFLSKINMTCVKSDGTVDPNVFGPLKNWSPKYTLETVLVELKREMLSPQVMPSLCSEKHAALST